MEFIASHLFTVLKNSDCAAEYGVFFLKQLDTIFTHPHAASSSSRESNAQKQITFLENLHGPISTHTVAAQAAYLFRGSSFFSHVYGI
jgi:hypothetical protein